MNTRVCVERTKPPVASNTSARRGGLLQRKCVCGGTLGVCGECAERRTRQLRCEPATQGELTKVPAIVREVLRSPGQPLDPATRAFMEVRFGRDFSQVRVHTDSRAAESAWALNALAFTVGRDIAFGHGQYAPGMNDGRKLIAHELAHVVQQSSLPTNRVKQPEMSSLLPHFEREATAVAHGTSVRNSGVSSSISQLGIKVQRQPRRGAGDDKPKLPKLDYRAAERLNKSLAGPDSLGWDSKLVTVSGGIHRNWADLWRAGRYDDFADAVAEFQSDSEFRKETVDGILGLRTWSKIAGLGEAIAGIQNVRWEESEGYCTIATRERIMRGHKLATGKRFELPEDKSAQTFSIILQSMENCMADIDQEYRGTGAAGALVYAGFATFVNEADIWSGGLRPGAALQVWAHRDAYDLLQAGVIEDAESGKPRKIRADDADFSGTSLVFVRYDDPANPTQMLVRHFGLNQWKDPSDYDVWIAANIN